MTFIPLSWAKINNGACIEDKLKQVAFVTKTEKNHVYLYIFMYELTLIWSSPVMAKNFLQ